MAVLLQDGVTFMIQELPGLMEHHPPELGGSQEGTRLGFQQYSSFLPSIYTTVSASRAVGKGASMASDFL